MCYHHDTTTTNNVFPEKIQFGYGLSVNVIEVLLEHVPFYLWRIAEEGVDHEDGEDAKYQYENIHSVDIVCINTDNEPWCASEESIDGFWGAGLKVNLTTDQYFLLYIPFDMNHIERDIEDFAEEAYNGIEVVPANTDLNYQLNKMPYSHKSDVIFKCTDGNTLTLQFS